MADGGCQISDVGFGVKLECELHSEGNEQLFAPFRILVTHMSTNQTVTFFVLCDLYSKCLLSSKNSMVWPDVIPNGFEVNDGTEKGTWLIIFNQLYADGYLKKAMFNTGSDSDFYILTSEGRLFIQKGGYGTLFKENLEIKQLNKKQIQSVIDTNQISRRIGWIALFIAGAAALASIAQYFKKPDELIQPSLDTLNKEVKLLRESLQKEVPNLKIHTGDTLNVKVSK